MTLIANSLAPFPGQDVLDRWVEPQNKMAEIVRWKVYSHSNPAAIRAQNNLAHTYGITQLARQFCGWMKYSCWAPQYPSFDGLLLLSAITHHDEGEGYTKVDHPKFKKRDEHDLAEYLAMCKVWKDLPEYVRRFEKESFLLQFCIKCPSCFPFEAQEVMQNLQRSKRNEALAFACLECYDYILYAIEQYQRLNNEMIMVQILRDQAVVMDQLCTSFFPFTHFWTPPVRAWCYQALGLYEGQFTARPVIPE